MRTCSTRVEGTARPFARQIPAHYRRNAVRVGPFALINGEGYARSLPSLFAPVGVEPLRYHPQKMLAVVRAGSVATLRVPEPEQRKYSLLYDSADKIYTYEEGYRLADGERSVRFEGCPVDTPSSTPGAGDVGRWTEFDGGFIVTGTGCITIDVQTERPARSVQKHLSFGGGRRC